LDHEFLEATNLLRRIANGDYSADQHLQSLPEYSKVKPLAKGSDKTCFELFGLQHPFSFASRFVLPLARKVDFRLTG